MKLSIVVLCLNEEKRLPRCLRAIRELDHAGLELEVLVVDGGSQDRSRELARELGASVVPSERGIPKQRNVGGRAATGELLAYVDADVELRPGWFETVARHAAQGTRMVVGGPPRLPEDASWIARAYALHWGAPGEGEADSVSDDARMLSTQSLAMGREVFSEVGGFREDLGVDEDTYFVLGAKERGARIVCDTGLRYVHHGEPLTLKDFFRRFAWGANYEQWFDALRRGDLAQAWRPQYLYGAVVGAELACLGASLALPLGGWQLGVPAACAALGATTVLPALRTAHRHRAYGKLGDLVVMYGAYGLAQAAAMVGLGRNKSKRWR
jgi:glycosyltransferase involved in cell wall biosynthesis